MASTTNAFSLSLSSKPNIKSSSSDFNPNSSDFLIRVNKPAKVSLHGSSYGGLNPVRVAVSRARGSRGRICANATQVMDQSVGEKSSRTPTIVEVDLGNRSYPIYIGSGLLDQPELLQKLVNSFIQFNF